MGYELGTSPEDGGSVLFWDIGTDLQVHMVS